MPVSSIVSSVTCPLVIRHRGTQADDCRMWTDMNRTITRQVMKKYWTKRIGNRQRAESHWIVIRWFGCLFTILSMHKTPQCIHHTSTDINIHVTDKADIDGWLPNDEQINISVTHALPQSVIVWQGALTFKGLQENTSKLPKLISRQYG